MTVTFQCSRCHETLSVGGEFTGQTMPCPMCEERLTVPAHDAERVMLEQDVAAAVANFKLTEWDRVYARKVLELLVVTPAVLRDALSEVRNAARRNEALTLDEVLVRRSAIGHTMAVVIRELVKAGLQSQVRQARECPNCFGAVPVTATACPFCGTQFGDLALQDACPNCLRRQPAGDFRCRTCGADMETGVKPARKPVRCPGCGFVTHDDYLDCPMCRTALDRWRVTIMLERCLQRLRRWLATAATLLLIPVLAAGGVLAYRHWTEIRRWYVVNTKGESRAALEDLLAEFDTAVKYGDLELLSRMVDPELKRRVDAAARAHILGVTEPGASIRLVSEIRHHDWIVSEEEGSATVYTQVRGELVRDKLAAAATPADLQHAAGQLRGEGPLLDAVVPWRWTRCNGRWYFKGPLPEASAPASPGLR